MNNILFLTGHSGFIGNALLNELKNNFKVYTIGRSLKSDIFFDLNKENWSCNFKPEIIIHAAGIAHFIPKTEEQEKLIYKTNVLGTVRLINGLSKNNLPKKFIFFSSVSVYGLNQGININENAPLLANDPYGKSKVEAEKVIMKWCKENDILCTIFRLPLVVGLNPPGNLGAMIKGIKKGYYFNISGGTAKKSMVLVSDIAKFIIKAAEVGGIYNLTDGKNPSLSELSSNISKKIGKSSVPNLPYFIAYILAKLGDIFGSTFPINSYKLRKITSDLTFDDSAARISFGWEPTSVLDGFKLN
jgi:nucleoside-diphosphate-sugar epimerase